MPNFIVTFNIYNYSQRIDVVRELEEVLFELGVEKEHSNQTTHYGYSSYDGTWHFAYLIVNKLKVRRMYWDRRDIITVYAPGFDRIGNCTIKKRYIKYNRKEGELVVE